MATHPLLDEHADTRMIRDLLLADLDEDDRRQHSATEWQAISDAFRQFASHFPDSGPKLRLFNPGQAADGWHSTHTVLELVQHNMPFLIDTITIAIQRMGLSVHLLSHPIPGVERSAEGRLLRLEPGAQKESWIHIELDRIANATQAAALSDEILSALHQLATCVIDWPRMVERTRAAQKNRHDDEAAFLAWLLADNFVFLGVRIGDEALGLLRGQHVQPLDTPSGIQLFKSATRSQIHRAAHLDCIVVPQTDAPSLEITGLYTSSAYNTPARQIPLLRSKIKATLERCAGDLSGYRGKALLNILDTYPRDELVEIGVDDLARIASGIAGLNERSRVRVFFREDASRRYLSVMVFVPRDNYTTEVRTRIQQHLLARLQGFSAEFNALVTDQPLARIHFLIRTPQYFPDSAAAHEIEAEIAALTQRWTDQLRRALLEQEEESTALALHQRYQHAFSAGYCTDYTPNEAVADIHNLELALKQQRLVCALKRVSVTATPGEEWRLKLHYHQAIELSGCLPFLENLGVRVLDERPYALQLASGQAGWIIDIGLRLPTLCTLASSAEQVRFLDAFARIFAGGTENDSCNKLVIVGGLAWREVFLLRATLRYLRQIGLKYEFEAMIESLLRHAAFTRRCISLFNLWLHPQEHEHRAAEALHAELQHYCSALANPDDEKILGTLLATFKAMQRTNFYQKMADDQDKPWVSFKLASGQIPGIPQPAPLYEIFVYSPDMEGIHLRGGKIARGGIRWSDRREDFRTEVLGLVKAQMVKNTVIVPVGSKGGFIVKNPPLEREALQARGVAAYQTLIRGLLDLTDNRQDGYSVPPRNLVRRDDDDPYLVVAADKGTATFSDIANGISREYGFWLDDAFASGGSAGYDHKKMGITARGAWIAAERHFHELGRDIDREPFTVVGIGDMSGDVFGNGLLRSPATRLIAAFDHRHIFLDPNPDAIHSFAERQRLFALPRSSWADYDAQCISQGGGVWGRDIKTIPLSDEIRAALDLDDASLSPDELIRAILKAPVDLLYNGGIGCYIKASGQSHPEAGDRSNDAVRVDGRELRCKVLVEGGNLGCTQMGRIEYAQTGGRIQTDAIDNSAGVDCSDHEVNIKILLGQIPELRDHSARNALLASMTQDVAELVLADNRLQTRALTLEECEAVSLLPAHQRFMQLLEREAGLSRRLEYLPGDAEIIHRQKSGLGLTRPELSVLLAYAKIWLKKALDRSTLPDETRWLPALQAYFPPALAAYADAMAQHPLRRDIIITRLANEAVNRQGITTLFRLAEETGTTPLEALQALLQARTLLNTESLLQAIENQLLAPAEENRLLLQLRRQAERTARSLLQNPQLGHFGPAVQKLFGDTKSPETAISQRESTVILLRLLAAGLPVKDLRHGQDLLPMLQTQFDLEWLSQAIDSLPRDNRWQVLARQTVRDEYQANLALAVTHIWQAASGSPRERLNIWVARNQESAGRLAALFAELRELAPDLATLGAACREMRLRLTDGRG